MNFYKAILLLSVFSLISCEAEHTSLSSNQGNYIKNSNPDPLIISAAKTVIENSCASCHNTTNGTNTRFLPGPDNNTNMDTLIDDTSYVQLGVPSGSLLLSYFASMPPGSPLGTNSTEALAVSAWIDEMGVFTGDTSGPTFTQVWTNTLSPKCLDCHSASAVGGPAGSVAFDNHTDLLSSIVTAGNSQASLIVDSITNRMPKETRGSVGKVTDTNHQYFVSQQELDDIIAWIDAGAQNN